MRKVRNRISCYKITFRFCFSIPVCAFIVISKDSTARRRNRTHFCTRALFSVQSTHIHKALARKPPLICANTGLSSLSRILTHSNGQIHKIISKYHINTIGYVLSECKELRKKTRVYWILAYVFDLDLITFVTSVYILFAFCLALTNGNVHLCVCDYFGDAFQYNLSLLRLGYRPILFYYYNYYY